MRVAVRPVVATVVNATESTAKPGKPTPAVAVTVALFGVAGNSGPKLEGLAVIVTNGGGVELSNVPA